MSISISPSTNLGDAEKPLLTERLARTVSEIDPSPRNAFAVAVILEVLGYTDQRAARVGWPDIFALARDVLDRVEFLRGGDPRTRSREAPPPPSNAPSPLISMMAQHSVWLVMVVLMIAWGRSVWSADHLPPSMAQALTVGILGSLVVSGGFQYAMTRRLLFHTAQRDLMQARAFLHRATWSAGLTMCAGGLAVAVAFWVARPGDLLAPLLAAGYFLLHGNYRVAVVPLIALNDVAGIILSTGAGIGLLALAYGGLVHAGTSATMAVVVAQLVGLTALWLGSLARARSLLGSRRGGVGGGAHRIPRARWLVLCLDAAPWFATGILYYVFLFATRPLAGMLPPTERLAYETGVDLGILAIVPVAITTSWGLYRYYAALREQLTTTPVLRLAELRTQAILRFSRMAWRCRLFGIAAAVGLLAASDGTPWGTMSAPAFTVFRITLVGLLIVLPGLWLSFGLLTSLGALRDAAGALGCGLILQLAGGLLVARWQAAGWLALALVGSAAFTSELAAWRAHRIVRYIDRFYYAAF
jgi:hypothetical protein